MKIKKEDIAEYISVCPYCYEMNRGQISCCGENHFEDGYLLENGEIFLESDITEITEPTLYEIEERLLNHRADLAYDYQKDEL